ncbi:MAG: hypothetical protein ABWW66_05320 [Archaeoglobaceae archaeon]
MLNMSIATTYVMDGFRANFLLMAEVFRVIATNSTVADYVAQDIYYFFGLLKWVAAFLNDTLSIINAELLANNVTWKQILVGYWQKTALNSTYILGDWEGTQGLAYIWKKGYECVQPGQYCYNLSYGNLTTGDALEMVKWQFNAMAEVGKRLASFYP